MFHLQVSRSADTARPARTAVRYRPGLSRPSMMPLSFGPHEEVRIICPDAESMQVSTEEGAWLTVLAVPSGGSARPLPIVLPLGRRSGAFQLRSARMDPGEDPESATPLRLQTPVHRPAISACHAMRYAAGRHVHAPVFCFVDRHCSKHRVPTRRPRNGRLVIPALRRDCSRPDVTLARVVARLGAVGCDVELNGQGRRTPLR